jgi:hypothetical protein
MKNVLLFGMAMLLAGCAGLSRGCSSVGAEAFGGDWVIVQYSTQGAPIRCWKLANVSITNEPQSDGIYWVGESGLVHISGWYNRVQVVNGKFGAAAAELGVSLGGCAGGTYVAP